MSIGTPLDRSGTTQVRSGRFLPYERRTLDALRAAFPAIPVTPDQDLAKIMYEAGKQEVLRFFEEQLQKRGVDD